jgi:ribosomal protein L40E
MTGLMQRIRRRGDERTEAIEAQGVEAQPSDAATTHIQPQPAPSAGPAGPAGAEPADVAAKAPGFRRRARMRRRLRYLRRVRELGFRDLGGLVFDQHRFGRPDENLVRGKVDALQSVDAEIRVLAAALGDERPLTELREPGVTACPHCGALAPTDARYCSACGEAMRGPRSMAGTVVPTPSGPAHAPAEPGPPPGAGSSEQPTTSLPQDTGSPAR